MRVKIQAKALVMGYYGIGNLGDELMLHAIRRWLENQGVAVTVLSEKPAVVEQEHRVPAILNVPLLGEWAAYDSFVRGKAFRLLKQLPKFDIMIGGGGDTIRDDRGFKQFLFSVEKYVFALLFGR